MLKPRVHRISTAYKMSVNLAESRREQSLATQREDYKEQQQSIGCKAFEIALKRDD